MSKRFIDTEIFSDPWFMDLSVNAKLFYIYLITNCDHAGIIEINWKLAELQTGIKQLAKTYDTLTKEYGDRLIRLRAPYFFIPKFIEFQYPGFPKSRVRQQEGAIKRLLEFNLFDQKNQTLNKELPNSYEDDSVSDNVSEDVNDKGESEGGIVFEQFWELYDKKISRSACEKKWTKLKEYEREAIMQMLPTWLRQFTDKQYQPHPQTFLNQRRWEDEVVLPKSNIEQYRESFNESISDLV